MTGLAGIVQADVISDLTCDRVTEVSIPTNRQPALAAELRPTDRHKFDVGSSASPLRLHGAGECSKVGKAMATFTAEILAKMIGKHSEAEAKSGRGQTFPKPLPYGWDWTEYPDGEEGDKLMVEAGDTMTLEEQRLERNRQRQNAARNASYNAAMDANGIEKQNTKNNVELRVKLMARMFLQSGVKSEAVAMEKARKAIAEALAAEAAEEAATTTEEVAQ